MNQEVQKIPKITEEEWARTTESVKQVLGYLTNELEKLKKRVMDLEEENRYLKEQIAKKVALQLIWAEVKD
ncbi:MAG: hypothetical protein J0M03_17540 [Acidobacteria bacterium]|nr:hypothetical protein [Acidobacteriota bacterium]